MTDDELDERDSLLSPLYAITTLKLRPLSWRTFFHATMPGCLNSESIEIQCRWVAGWDDKIEVGGEKLSSLPIALQISKADQAWLDKTLQDQGIVLDEKGYSRRRPWVGKLNYWKPLHTSDGVLDDKHGSVTGWVAFGPENYDRIMAQLLAGKPHFLIGIEVRFEEKTGIEFPSYKWVGDKQVEVVGGNLVIFSDDPDAPDEVEVEADPEPQDEPLLPAAASNDQLLAAIQKLYTPLWVIAGAVIIGIATLLR